MTAVLAINAGSSSIKFGLFEEGAHGAPVLLAKGTLEDAGPDPRLRMNDASGSVLRERGFSEGSSHESIFEALLEAIDQQLGDRKLAGVGHRVVHGGRDFDKPVLIDAGVLVPQHSECDSLVMSG